MIGLVVWGVLFGLLFAYQGLALVSTNDRWPSFSHVLRVVMRNPAGRWTLFGLWLWLGWHLFARSLRLFVKG